MSNHALSRSRGVGPGPAGKGAVALAVEASGCRQGMRGAAPIQWTLRPVSLGLTAIGAVGSRRFACREPMQAGPRIAHPHTVRGRRCPGAWVIRTVSAPFA